MDLEKQKAISHLVDLRAKIKVRLDFYRHLEETEGKSQKEKINQFLDTMKDIDEMIEKIQNKK